MNHITEVERQFYDATTYKLLEKDPTPTFNEEIREFLLFDDQNYNISVDT